MMLPFREHRAPAQSAPGKSLPPCLSPRDRASARLGVKSSVLLVLVVALFPACRRDARNENSTTPPPAVSLAPTTTSTSDHAEVFRRAFWRQPSSADHILQAERRISPDDNSWQWFIQLHPSPELLAVLRDPENLGLLSTSALRPWPTHPDTPPTWFPAATTTGDFEVLQAPATSLTVLYHAADNTLFATDHGADFAPPAR